MFENWDFALSAITATTAVIALMLTFWQIRLNNKQSLFDRRLEAFLKVRGLVQLYEENKSVLIPSKEDGPDLSAEITFLRMTNNAYLEEIGRTIYSPLKEPAHEQFLKKLEDIKQLVVETELIFNGRNIVKTVCSFIANYEELLFELYQYQILLNHMEEYSKKFQATLEDSQKKFHEPECRKSLFATYETINASYNLIVQANAIIKLKKQIKL